MKLFIIVVAALLASFPAFGHHPLGGMPMETFAHGLLSGFGHPILGFDHLFFVILIGICAQFTGHGVVTPGAYIIGMLLGCLMVAGGITLPAVEIMIALSLLILGAIVLAGRTLEFAPAIALFSLFGLFHGAAFGETIAAQESAAGTPVLAGYLLGLGCVQFAIALGAGWINNHVWKALDPVAIQPRLAGAMVAGVGLFLTLENIEGPLLKTIFS